MAYSLNELNNRLPKLIVIMKKHELLKHAYDNYPKGTKFRTLIDGGLYTSSGSFKIFDESIVDSKSGHYIFEYGKWAKIQLITTLDGIPLYDGDKFVFVNRSPKDGYYINDYHGKMYILNEKSMCFQSPEKYLVFSSRQSALEWIESQKPKTKELSFNKWGSVLVKSDKVEFQGMVETLSKDELMQIVNAIEELQND